MKRSDIVGLWEITEMELWDDGYLSLGPPPAIEFKKKQGGQFNFGLVQADIDYVIDTETDRAEFTWDGVDEMDQVNGRGYFRCAADKGEGRIFTHLGDSSGFHAVRKKNQN